MRHTTCRISKLTNQNYVYCLLPFDRFELDDDLDDLADVFLFGVDFTTRCDLLLLLLERCLREFVFLFELVLTTRLVGVDLFSTVLLLLLFPTVLAFFAGLRFVTTFLLVVFLSTGVRLVTVLLVLFLSSTRFVSTR